MSLPHLARSAARKSPDAAPPGAHHFRQHPGHALPEAGFLQMARAVSIAAQASLGLPPRKTGATIGTAL
jgi:hypothetical protein